MDKEASIKKYLSLMYNNPGLAETIKDLRVTKGYSWRTVANEIAEMYNMVELVDFGENGFNAGNQQEGILLCSAARQFFNEDVKDGWN
jgi:hypothetical protein